MRLRRLGLPFGSLIVLAAGLCWLLLFRTPSAHTQLGPGRWYELDAKNEQATLDLPAVGGDYSLVIASLGNPAHQFRVTLDTEAANDEEQSTATLIDPRCAGQVLGLPRQQRAGAENPLPIPNVASTREFSIHVTEGPIEDPANYAKVVGKIVREGRHVRVYLDQQQPERHLNPGLLDDIVDVLDNRVMPRLSEFLGRYRDVDNDGKFAVLISPWLEKLQGGKTSLGGFVRGSDFCATTKQPFGNCCDMLYLNANLSPGRHLETLLMHEFAHAVSFSERAAAGLGNRELPNEDDWLSEGLAHVIENMSGQNWSNLDHRVAKYLNDPGDYPLIVKDYFRAGRWRDHGCRGATYLFNRWCVDQFGDALLYHLVRSPAVGVRNLEATTGAEFPDLFRRWLISLADEHSGLSSRSSVDVYQGVGEWALAGPRLNHWNAEDGPKQVGVHGTAGAFIEMHVPATRPGAAVRRLKISAERGCRLQVSVMRRASNWPQLRLEQHSLIIAERSMSPTVQVSVIGNPTQELQIESIVCEFDGQDSRRPMRIGGEQLAAHHSGASTTNDRRWVETYSLPMPSRDRAMMIKVVARDSLGRRTAVWSRIGSTPNRLALVEPQRRSVR